MNHLRLPKPHVASTRGAQCMEEEMLVSSAQDGQEWAELVPQIQTGG
jgi:hypothetical protein